jgi:hypothetical protein
MGARLSLVAPLRSVGVAAAAVLGGLLLAAGPAGANTAPVIADGPQIAGSPQAETTLAASAAWTGEPEPEARWAWERCAPPGGKCERIVGAAGQTYRVTTADVGLVLRVHLKVTNVAGAAEARSAPTPVIEAAALPPVPVPPPPPPPTPVEPPTAAGPLGTSRPPLLDPFPTVRIRGRLTPDGARVTRLTVRAPRGVSVVASCHGRGCPARRLALASGIRLRRFERELRAGTRLEITVTKPGYIGKWTTIVIRRGEAPRRLDRCVYPGARDPVQCPAS